MKVLFATYPMAFHTPGGGEVQLLAYKKHLPSHGVDVTLFDPWNPRFMDYDAVHFFSCIGGSSHFCRFIKQLGLPLFVSSSLWITEETKHLYPVDEIRIQLDLADCVVTNSNLESQMLSQVLNLPLNKFEAVYNGVDDIFFQAVPAELFRDNFGIQEKFVLNVGNIEPRKNQLALIRAMKSFPEMKLVLIGHQRDTAYANQCIEEGGDQLIYVGPIDHYSPLLRSAYSACELFCLPSTLETPGLAALEAYASGCAIAVTEIGSAKEYFFDNVQYVNPDTDGSIIKAINEIIKERKISKKIAPSANDFNFINWNSVTQPLKKIYRSRIEK